MDDTTNKEITRLLKRGLNHYGFGDIEQAIACWEQVIGLDPDNSAARDYLETAYEELEVDSKEPVTAKSGVDVDSTGEIDVEVEIDTDPDVTHPTSVPTPEMGFDDPTPRRDGPEGMPLPGAEEAASQPAPQLPSAAELDAPDTLVKEALDAYQRGDLDTAWSQLSQAAEKNPKRLDVQGYLVMIRSERAQGWAREIGDQGRSLQRKRSMQEMMKLNLAPDEGYLLSQIDGSLSIEQLISLSSTDRVRTLEILARFLRDDLVE